MLLSLIPTDIKFKIFNPIYDQGVDFKFFFLIIIFLFVCNNSSGDFMINHRSEVLSFIHILRVESINCCLGLKIPHFFV